MGGVSIFADDRFRNPHAHADRDRESDGSSPGTTRRNTADPEVATAAASLSSQQSKVDDDGVADFEVAWQRARQKKISTVVVLGAPGSGKTTLLRSLLLRCVDDPATIAMGADSLPVLLPLRELREEEDLKTAIERLHELKELKVPVDLFEQALFDGRVLLLFRRAR